jgi:DNA mismatch endonuclease (patch repair protein)
VPDPRDTKPNAKWWAHKIAANKQRNAETNELLVAAGRQLIRISEHQDLVEVAERVHGRFAQ